MTGCGCHGGDGIAHVSCLVRMCQVAVTSQEEGTGFTEDGGSLLKWQMCSVCMQSFYGAVRLALGWAMWKSYLARPEADFTRCVALGVLGMAHGGSPQTLVVMEAHHAYLTRFWPHKRAEILVSHTNLATILDSLGRYDDALRRHREVYAGYMAHTRRIASTAKKAWLEECLHVAGNLADSLLRKSHRDEPSMFAEVKTFSREQRCDKSTTFLAAASTPHTTGEQYLVARRELGSDHPETLRLQASLACALFADRNFSRENPSQYLHDLYEAKELLESSHTKAKRVHGPQHWRTVEYATNLKLVNEILDEVK